MKMNYLTDSNEVSEAEVKVRAALENTTVYVVEENKWKRKRPILGGIEISELNAADLPSIRSNNGSVFYFFTKADIINYFKDENEDDWLEDFKSKLEAQFEGDPLLFSQDLWALSDINDYEIVEEKAEIILKKYEECVQTNLDNIKSYISKTARCSKDFDELDYYFFFQNKEDAAEYKNILLEEEDE